MNSLLRLCLLAIIPVTGGCQLSKTLENAARKITLNTPEPIKVDMKITLDVIQHDAPGAKKLDQKEESNDIAEVTRRKFNRQAEIQTIKNSRLVAETHQGLLFLREQPPGPNGGYVKDLVEKENADRKLLMIEDARKQKRELHELEKERFEINVKNAFAGEWIEIADPMRPGGYKLVQKQ